jgi:hypothetical protein
MHKDSLRWQKRVTTIHHFYSPVKTIYSRTPPVVRAPRANMGEEERGSTEIHSLEESTSCSTTVEHCNCSWQANQLVPVPFEKHVQIQYVTVFVSLLNTAVSQKQQVALAGILSWRRKGGGDWWSALRTGPMQKRRNHPSSVTVTWCLLALKMEWPRGR